MGLQSLLLGKNNFTGALPVNWSTLGSLQELGLDRNRLTGRFLFLRLGECRDVQHQLLHGLYSATHVNPSLIALLQGDCRRLGET